MLFELDHDMSTLQMQMQILKLTSPGYLDARNLFLSSFRRDVLQNATSHDEEVTRRGRDGGTVSRDGDPVADAYLFEQNIRRDDSTFLALYGLSWCRISLFRTFPPFLNCYYYHHYYQHSWKHLRDDRNALRVQKLIRGHILGEDRKTLNVLAAYASVKADPVQQPVDAELDAAFRAFIAALGEEGLRSDYHENLQCEGSQTSQRFWVVFHRLQAKLREQG